MINRGSKVPSGLLIIDDDDDDDEDNDDDDDDYEEGDDGNNKWLSSLIHFPFLYDLYFVLSCFAINIFFHI